MRYLLILLFVSISITLTGATYYLSPTGSDAIGNGSISSPWFTLNKAWTVVAAGDIIYLRGGTYQYVSRQTLSGKNGTATNLISVFAYPGESPNLTKHSSFSTPSWPISLVYLQGNYTYWKGIEISNFKQASSGLWYAIALRNANHNKFEEINSHHNGHGMVIRDACTDNLIYNSDFHHNYDPLTSTPYENADGIEIGYLDGTTVNTIRGCRFYNNSDDGVDLWDNNGKVNIENSWSWNNGYREDGVTIGGNGNGFKFGKTTIDYGNTIMRTIKNCVAYNNRAIGFDQNGALCGIELQNNSSYKNLTNGYKFNYNGIKFIAKNNLCYSNSSVTEFTSTSILETNSFSCIVTNPFTVTPADFVSLDGTQLTRSRQSDGNLPEIDFLHLVTGSDLVNSGVNIGLPYNGGAPDIGAFETGAVTTPALPVYTSSVVENATATKLEMTYNLSLANIAPAASAFIVRVNSVARTINTVAISGTKVTLTLSSAVVYGDAVTVAYTKPSANPLQTSSGGQAASITAQTVTNKVNSVNPANPVNPVYMSSVVENATPSYLEMTYNSDLANTIPAVTAFTVHVNGVRRNVSSVVISGNKVRLTFAIIFIFGDKVFVTYNKPMSNWLQTTTGEAESITSQPVTNNCLQIAIPNLSDKKHGKVTIYPNPAHDFFNIAIEDATVMSKIIKIFDLSGKIVHSESLEAGIEKVQIPVNLKTGIYIVILESNNLIVHTQKLIINS